MPPEELPSSSHPLRIPFVQHSVFLKLPANHIPILHKPPRRRMNLTTRKLIPMLVLVLILASLLRLLKITHITSSPPPPPPSALLPPALLNKNKSDAPSNYRSRFNSSWNVPSLLTEKELLFLSDIIFQKAPCNLLVFGLQEQYLTFPFINAGGTTIFLEDNPDKISAIKTNFNTSTRAHRVVYKNSAKEAYELLKHARGNPDCSPRWGLISKVSKCKLALTELPKEVYEIMWDVIVVDGPSGDAPEAPGRMAAIFTASMLARSGNMTNVVVHDVQRVIEKWYSWEFLCDENLVSSEGRFWNFRIAQQSNSSAFCP